MNAKAKEIIALITLALAAMPAAKSQPGTVSVHPAGPQDGKEITMQDIYVTMGIYARPVSARWGEGSTYSYMKDGKSFVADAATGEVREEERPAGAPGGMRLGGPMGRRGGDPRLPEGASEITPNGGNVAYTLGNSLYYLDAEGVSHEVAVSSDPNIVYGTSVSRNEFGIMNGIFWSPDGSKIAFYYKDESLVTDFPLLDISTRTGTLKNIKYPMNGMDSENVRLGIYSLEDESTVWAAVDDFGYDQYLTNISWGPDSKNVFIQVLDRSQKHVHLNMYRAADGSFVRTLLTEDNERFVEPQDVLEFVKGSYDFLYRTDNRDGYKNLYLCDTLGTVIRLTAVDADVTYLDNDGSTVWYTSAEVSPVENHLFCVSLKYSHKNGAIVKYKATSPVRLTAEEGWHRVSLSPDYKYFIDSFSCFNVPGVTKVKDMKGAELAVVGEVADPLAEYATGEVTLGTVKSADGLYDNWYRMFKPKDFDPSKKYPVVVYVYGGPHSQMVTDSWLGSVRLWEMYMAQKGYIVYVQDGRGTSNRGAEYEKAIHKQCGQAEMADQMVGVEMLKSLPYVDAERIGVHGWSYGGFMTISLLTNYPETFKVGVAGGPVIDWKWYEVMYGERYMETEATNPEGFAKTSLINMAPNLKGKLLICQGAIDNTVVWEHSLSFVQSCIENNIQLDYFPYPLSEHNVAGPWRVHLMDKVSEYFFNWL